MVCRLGSHWITHMKKTYTAPVLRVCGSLEALTEGVGNGGGFPGKGNAYGHDKRKTPLTFS